MSAAWDDEDFDPIEGLDKNKKSTTDKWDDEDEDDAKDAWDDSDDDQKQEKKPQENGENGEIKAVQKKKKKPLSKRLLEKEAQEQQEREAPVLSAEEQAAERRRIEKEQEEADLKLAVQAFGISDKGAAGGDTIESMNPVSKSEFEEFNKHLVTKITAFEKSPHYTDFLEKLCRDCALSLQPEDLKRIGVSLTTLATEKAKAQKGTTAKSKKKGKASIQKVRDDDYKGEVGNDYNDYDDFI